MSSTLTATTGLGTWLEGTLKRAGVDPNIIEGMTNEQLLALPGVDSQVLAAIRMMVSAPNGQPFPGPIEDEPARATRARKPATVTAEVVRATPAAPVTTADRATPRIDPKVLWAPRRGRLPEWLRQARAEAIARGEGPETAGAPTTRTTPRSEPQHSVRVAPPVVERSEPKVVASPVEVFSTTADLQAAGIPATITPSSTPAPALTLHVNVTRLASGALRGLCPGCGSIYVWNPSKGDREEPCSFCARNRVG